MGAGPALAAAIALAVGANSAAVPKGYIDRLEQLARLQSLNADLLSHDSATAVLQGICDRIDPAKPRIVAHRRAEPSDPSAETAARRDLGLSADAPVRYRRVELACGAVVLSRAENWYAPDRLTPEMNQALETSQTPFGVVVKPLGFQRRTLSATPLYRPLPDDWAARPRTAFATRADPPRDVLQHRAILATAAGQPFSVVVETYSRDAILGRRQPPPIRPR